MDDYDFYDYGPSYDYSGLDTSTGDWGGYDSIFNGYSDPNADMYSNFDFGSLFDVNTPTYDYSGLDTSTGDWGGYDQIFNPTVPADTPTNEYGQTLGQMVDMYSAPKEMSLGSSTMPNALTGNYGQSLPSSSYVAQNGGVIGIPSSGADAQNPYQYATGPSGDTFVVDSATGKAVGYLDASGNPMMYGDVALQNGAPLSAISGGALQQPLTTQPKATGASGSGSGGGGSQPKQEAKTPLQQGLSNAALIAQLLNALGMKGVKPPAPADSKGTTAMSWNRVNSPLQSASKV